MHRQVHKHKPPSRGMDTNAHHRRLKTLALARARLHGSHGADFMQHLGNLDHIEFEKHEAGDYRAVIDGVELRISRESVDFRPVGEWVLSYRVVSRVAGWDFGFRPLGPIFKTLKDARAELLAFVAHADGAQLWKGL